MKDQITDMIHSLPGELPTPRALSESQKDELIDALGYKTVQNILSLKNQYSNGRICFLFNSLDPQLVLDALENTMADALTRRTQAQKP